MNIQPLHARYRINAALFAPAWVPEPWQVVYFPNPHRLNALWLGTVWNFMLLPTRVWHESLKLLFTPVFYMAPVTLCMVMASTLKWIGMGLTGKLRGLHLPMQVRMMGDIVSPARAVELIKAGDDRAVVDMLTDA